MISVMFLIENFDVTRIHHNTVPYVILDLIIMTSYDHDRLQAHHGHQCSHSNPPVSALP